MLFALRRFGAPAACMRVFGKRTNTIISNTEASSIQVEPRAFCVIRGMFSHIPGLTSLSQVAMCSFWFPGLRSSPLFCAAWVEITRFEAQAPPDSASLSPLFPVAAVALLTGLSPESSSWWWWALGFCWSSCPP